MREGRGRERGGKGGKRRKQGLVAFFQEKSGVFPAKKHQPQRVAMVKSLLSLFRARFQKHKNSRRQRKYAESFDATLDV